VQRRVSMTLVCAALALPVLGAAAGEAAADEPMPAAGTAETPVLVELFTSEGCSSCPPADALVKALVAEQPIRGVRVVALGEHVDYWNYLGWRDGFSSNRYSDRQIRYRADAFPASAVYTPQVVVDGSIEVVGSDAVAVRRAIVDAARKPKAAVRLAARRADGSLAIDIDIPESALVKQPADVLVAVIEDGLSTAVERGENAGRTLTHSAVVRRLDTIGRIEPDSGELSLSTSVPMAADWRLAEIEVVAIVQDAGSRRVLGAAVTPVLRSRPVPSDSRP
jgi:hypothetical protein